MPFCLLETQNSRQKQEFFYLKTKKKNRLRIRFNIIMMLKMGNGTFHENYLPMIVMSETRYPKQS